LGQDHRPQSSYTSLGGLLVFLGCAQFLLMLVVASSLYPGYSISGNYISDLGATCRAGACVVFQPSSAIFNSSSVILGLLLALGSMLIRRGGGDGLFTALLLFSGLGAVGVGVFPESYGALHSISAMIAFLFGGAASIASYRILEGFPRIVGPVMGIMAIASLAMFISGNHLGLGPGGIERVLAYLELLFGVMAGGYLMGTGKGAGLLRD